ncbi:ribonuclease HII [candidate division GN15 bacterium]|nr:ribonuclease HII [candidate division GN15 bacterium]
MAEFFDKIERLMYEKGYRAVCGVDEAGRGPLAGPVVAAAVVIPEDFELDGLTDSKKLSCAQRNDIFEAIVELNLPCAIGIVDHETIDRVNILKASLIAMRKAIGDLKTRPDVVLVDGNQSIPGLRQPQFAIVGGDYRCKSIAAASVMAKVTRDRIMEKYEALYPAFSFATHKGYPTANHLRELREHGPTEIHRRSYRPVAELADQYLLF